MNKKEIIVEKNRKLVDLIQDFGFSFVDVNKMLRAKDVRVDGKVEKGNPEVEAGRKVTFYYSDAMLEKKYQKVFESDNILIVYKSAGIETAGEMGLEKFIEGVIAVHRLDRNTEGLLVFAKNKTSEEKLKTAFKNKLVHKFYVAEVVGEMNCSNETFSAYLLKDKESSFVKISNKKVPNSMKIQTKVSTIKAGRESSFVCVELLTGKTHQIRAHLAYLGHPIIGDGKYGKNEDNKEFGVSRQKLACFKLEFDDVGIEELNGKSFEKKPNWWNF